MHNKTKLLSLCVSASLSLCVSVYLSLFLFNSNETQTLTIPRYSNLVVRHRPLQVLQGNSVVQVHSGSLVRCGFILVCL